MTLLAAPLVALVQAGSDTTTTTVAQAAKSNGSLLDPIAHPIAALMAAIYSVVPNFGVAIMVVSVLWMIIIAPLTLKSTRSMLAMQKLQPQLKRLQEQHRNDRQAFAQAQMELFREHKVSPFGSCLPMLLPLPVFFALYRVISGLNHTVNGHAAPRYLSHSSSMYHDIVASHGHIVAFGMDLAKSALSAHSGVLAAFPFWLLLAIMAVTSYVQSAQMMSRNPAAQNNPQMKMMKYLPLFFVVISMNFPAGVVLYYVMSNICRIVQQDAMYRYDPKVKALVAREVIEVEEITRDIDERKNRPGYTPPRSARAADSPQDAPRSGRSRFRDLLAAAAEQQQTKSRSEGRGPSTNGSAGKNGAAGNAPAGNGSGGNGSGGNGSAGNGSGGDASRGNGSAGTKGRATAGAGGAAANRGGGRPQQNKARKNKKRGR